MKMEDLKNDSSKGVIADITKIFITKKGWYGDATISDMMKIAPAFKEHNTTDYIANILKKNLESDDLLYVDTSKLLKSYTESTLDSSYKSYITTVSSYYANIESIGIIVDVDDFIKEGKIDQLIVVLSAEMMTMRTHLLNNSVHHSKDIFNNIEDALEHCKKTLIKATETRYQENLKDVKRYKDDDIANILSVIDSFEKDIKKYVYRKKERL